MPHQPGAGFGDLLCHYRQAAGLTQGGLAEQAALSVPGVHDLEGGPPRLPHPDKGFVKSLWPTRSDWAMPSVRSCWLRLNGLACLLHP
jgi:helix-turn-helix protein